MIRTIVTLLAAVAVLTVAVGGVAATDLVAELPELTLAEDDDSDGLVGNSGDGDTGSESGSEVVDAEVPEDTDEEADVGVCMVGADSPCNGDNADGTDGETGTDGEPIGENDSDEDEQILIPEDQNRDGEIDDRFRGGDLLTDLLSSVFSLF